ncbi:MAG TPA: OmpA family protein [Dissulfurispiraceae bacterium]|nr:OmpA family protein [Dissulfurispiraceae bacterium]
MKKGRKIEEEKDQLDRWLISYADFLTLMFTFFAALYALSTVDKEKIGQFSVSLRQAFNVIERPIPGLGENIRPLMMEVNKSVANVEGINVKSDPRGVVITLSNDTAFKSGSADITGKMASALDSLSEVLKKHPGRIIIEGHTDNVPVSGGQFKSNWELSAARASSVLHLFMQQGVDPNRFIIAGYGEYRPLTSNNTAEGRAENRRVEIVVAPASMK